MACLAACLLHPSLSASQVVEEPILAGRAFLADSALSSGSVVLHRMTSAEQGEIDSVPIAPDGSFYFPLPSVPDETVGDVYFASVRHDGVMYFGNLVSTAVDLDSIYEIHAYDTIIAPPEGLPVSVEGRSIFFEPNGSEWAITDVFEVVNPLDRTIVPAESGGTWRYPLPAEARDVAAIEGMAADVITREGNDMVYSGALQPGQSPFLVVRYFVDSLEVTIPTPGETATLDILVREPAPAISVEGLVREQNVSMTGSTYRRFAGQGIEIPEIRITMAEEEAPPPVQWIAVALALVLLGGGLLALQRGRSKEVAPARGGGGGGGAGRQGVLIEIARLDEEYEAEPSPSAARTREYKRKRAELMRRLKVEG